MRGRYGDLPTARIFIWIMLYIKEMMPSRVYVNGRDQILSANVPVNGFEPGQERIYKSYGFPDEARTSPIRKHIKPAIRST